MKSTGKPGKRGKGETEAEKKRDMKKKATEKSQVALLEGCARGEMAPREKVPGQQI